jgi:hypothetical protein
MSAAVMGSALVFGGAAVFILAMIDVLQRRTRRAAGVVLRRR